MWLARDEGDGAISRYLIGSKDPFAIRKGVGALAWQIIMFFKKNQMKCTLILRLIYMYDLNDNSNTRYFLKKNLSNVIFIHIFKKEASGLGRSYRNHL